MKEDKQTMSEGEFCRRVGISRTTAWQLRKRGRLPYYRLGSKIMYGQDHVEEFLKSIERREAEAGKSKRKTAA